MRKVWEAKRCIVNKRSLPKQGAAGGGFSGAQNTLPHKDGTRMLLGSAKDVFVELNNIIGSEIEVPLWQSVTVPDPRATARGSSIIAGN